MEKRSAMRKKTRMIVNICLAVMVAGAWLGIIFLGGGDLAQRGIGSMKYFTVLSNLFCGIAAVLWLIYERKGGSEKVERIKYIAAASVGVKSRAVCPQIQPVAISAILAAGTRQSIFSLKEVDTRSSLMLMLWVVCFTLPKMSFCNHSSVSLFLAEPANTLPL